MHRMSFLNPLGTVNWLEYSFTPIYKDYYPGRGEGFVRYFR